MFCSNCGTGMDGNAKFCPNCGHENQPISKEVAEAANRKETSGNFGIKEYQLVQKSQAISESYLGVFKIQLKSPFYQAKKIVDHNMTNGLMSILLFAFVMAVSTYIIAQNSTSGFIDIPFFSTVFSLFFGTAVMLFLITGVIFISLKLMQVQTGFSVLINRTGSLMAAPLAIALVAMIVGIFQMTILANLLIGLASLGALISVFSVLYSYDSEEGKGLDPYFGSLIAVIGTAIVFFIIFVTVLESLISNLQNSMFW